MEPYTYQPLDLDRHALRFVRLLAGKFADSIKCELFQGWIEDGESGMPFDALSYTWGSVKKTASIEVEGSTMHVTENLNSALKHLRHENEDRILWIDAICIDQDNVIERGHQVQFMGDIYKAAERVVVWLGEGTAQSDFAMDAIKPLEKLPLVKTGDWRVLAIHLIGWDAHYTYDARLSLDTPSQIQLNFKVGMEIMLSRPWFKRIWVLQEIANARVALIVCGTKSVSAKVFSQVPSLLDLHKECSETLDIMPGFNRTESWWKQDRSLLTLLSKFKTCQASDTRDMVYALLGMSTDAKRSDILLPDYTKDQNQIVQTVVSYLLLPKNQDWTIFSFMDWNITELLGYASEGIMELRNTVLRLASKHGDTTTIRLLLDKNTEIDAEDECGHTALFFACVHGQTVVAEMLLENKAQIERRDSNGRTPLFFAVGNGHRSIVELLLQRGADSDVQDFIDLTVLFVATLKGDLSMARLLLDCGVKLSSRNRGGWTAYEYLEVLKFYVFMRSDFTITWKFVRKVGEIKMVTHPKMSQDTRVSEERYANVEECQAEPWLEDGGIKMATDPKMNLFTHVSKERLTSLEECQAELWLRMNLAASKA